MLTRFSCKRYFVFGVAVLCFSFLFDTRTAVAQVQEPAQAVKNMAGVFRLVREYKCQVSGLDVSIQGTAFGIHPSGIAVTCWHVVKHSLCGHSKCGKSSNIKLISYDKEFYPCQIIGLAQQYDLAFLRIDWIESFTSIPVSEHEVGINENVQGVFNLQNKGLFYVRGYLSAIEEMQVETVTHPKMLIFDMATGPGASGGPILSEHGELLAVACGRTDNNFTLGIPASNILPAVKKAASLDAVFGLETELQYESKCSTDKKGIYVSKIDDNPDAEKTGIAVGDQVTAIGPWEVNTAVDFELSALAWAYKNPETPMAVKVKKPDGTSADFHICLTHPDSKDAEKGAEELPPAERP